MNLAKYSTRIKRVKLPVLRLASDNHGTLLVYMVVVILIFGVLGVSLVSLFTTSTTSSATPNDAKRARYIAESGIRYALSEIRNSGDIEYAAELLNTTPEFKLGKQGSFTASVFSPGLKSAENKIIFGSGTLNMDVPYSGEFPSDFNIPNVSVIDWKRFKTTSPPSNSYAAISGSTKAAPPESVIVNLADDFLAITGDTICFALLATDAQTNISKGSSIYVDENARHFFPEQNGAIRILTQSDGELYDYFYETRVHDTANNRVELTNLREMPGGSWRNIADLQTTDYVSLSPYNFRVFASGKSDDTEVDVGVDKPFWALAIPSEYTIYLRELLQDKEIKEFGDVIRAPSAGDKIDLGAGGGGSPGFGDLWYSGDKSIGGDSDRCKQGRCGFNEGIRTFFTVRLSGDGEGFTFALLGGGNAADTIPPVNSALSAGGDVDASELLGYAGDSRTDSAGTAFVDDYFPTKPHGLLPPKMAVEFDTRTNLNEPLQYCTGSDLDENTRNDPMPENKAKDVIQYVFWGNETLAISCRGNGETYDDNRHNAEGDEASANWAFDTGIEVRSEPTFDPTDGTVYFGTNGSATDNLYALKSNGVLKWSFNAGNSNVTSKPALDTIGSDRYVYFSAADNRIYKMEADPPGSTGVQERSWAIGGSIIEKVSPAVNNNTHTIYIGSRGNETFYAYDPNGVELWNKDLGEDIEASAIIDKTGAIDGNVYVGTADDNSAIDQGQVFAFDPAAVPPSTPLWRFFPTDNDVESRPAINADGSVVYAVTDNGHVYAIPAATGSSPANWTRDVSGVNSIDPAVSPVDGTVYVATDDGHLHAFDPATGNDRPGWVSGKDLGAPIIYSSPAVGADGTIYIGTNGNRVYAINPDSTDKWEFPTLTGDDVRSTPEIGPDGAVYVGSDDGNLYAISTVATPRNYREDYPDFHQVPIAFKSLGFYPIYHKAHITDDDIEAGADIDVENDWLNGGSLLLPWAVRVEVEKVAALTYELKTWIRQCTIGDCSDIIDTLFQNTERKYDYSPLTYPNSTINRQPMVQTITLTAAEDEQFERILFGFTTAAKTGDSQLITIKDFQLTFIEVAREEAAVLNDPNWP